MSVKYIPKMGSMKMGNPKEMEGGMGNPKMGSLKMAGTSTQPKDGRNTQQD